MKVRLKTVPQISGHQENMPSGILVYRSDLPCPHYQPAVEASSHISTHEAAVPEAAGLKQGRPQNPGRHHRQKPQSSWGPRNLCAGKRVGEQRREQRNGQLYKGVLLTPGKIQAKRGP